MNIIFLLLNITKFIFKDELICVAKNLNKVHYLSNV